MHARSLSNRWTTPQSPRNCAKPRGAAPSRRGVGAAVMSDRQSARGSRDRRRAGQCAGWQRWDPTPFVRASRLLASRRRPMLSPRHG
jgi:hypothetical protein